jgi:peptidyl-prolyl cis-trans isomerase D
MLAGLRRHANSIIVRFILFGLALVFAFWIGGSRLFQQRQSVAVVDGQSVTADDLEQESERVRRSIQNAYGANAPALLKSINLRQQALDGIIEKQLIEREALRIGLEIDDDAVRKKIEGNDVFNVDGHFDFAAYQQVLRSNDLLPSQFEESTRVGLLTETLKDMISEGVELSDDEAREDFLRRNEKLSMRYIEIPFQSFEASIKPTEKEIDEHYRRFGESFREPERVKAIFIHYDPSTLAESVTPSDSEIKEYYERYLKTAFSHPEQIHVRHILIEVPSAASEKEKTDAKAKAASVLEQLRKGADFAKLAEQNSDDSGNKFKGGDLGSFARGQMVKPFEEAVFKLKPGELSDIIETRFGYHVAKVEEVRAPHVDTMEEARPKILQNLKQKAGADIARNAMHDDLQAALSGGDLKQLGARRGLEMVETQFFSQNDPVKGAERNPYFNQSVLKMDKDEVRVVTAKGYDGYLVKVLAKQPARTPPLKEIHDRVNAAIVREKAEHAARDRANDLLKRIKNAQDFEKVAAAEKLEIKSSGEFERSGKSVPTIGDFPEVTEAAGTVPQLPGVIPHAFAQGGNAYIMEVMTRTPPSQEEWNKAAKDFKKQLLEARRNDTWNRYLESLKRAANISVDTSKIGETPERPTLDDFADS